MGKTYLFECDHCGYRATVSGGADAGEEVKVQTARCKDCRTLFDAVVALRTTAPPSRRLKGSGDLTKIEEHPPTLSAALNRLPSRGAVPRHWRRFAVVCPVDPSHRVEPWNAPGRCPHCGDYLEPSALPYRRWD